MSKTFTTFVSICLILMCGVAFIGVPVVIAKAAETNSTLPFSDVTQDAWYYDDVSYVYAHGVMIGVSGTEFRPNGSMTASMAICALGRLEGMEPTYRIRSLPLTRQEFATVLYWYITVYRGYELTASTEKFTDDYDIPGFAKEAVYSLKQIGVLCGYPDETFRPERVMTRAEAAAMIHRMCDWMASAESY